MADWLVPLLLWLAENKPERVRKYAEDRWAWPGYFHMLKREQNRFESLLPKFNQAGTKVIKESPIGIGKNLGLNLNSRRMKADHLFFVAANSIYRITRPLKYIGDYTHWMWLENHHSQLKGLKPVEF